MQTPAVLDFDAILAPIPGDSPAGAYLREEDRTLYDSIRGNARQARSAEDRILPEAGSPLQAALPEWRTVRDNAVLALSSKTKDLEIAAYLIEALLRLNGPAGLRDGFRVVRELVERWWDALYPMPEEDIWERVVILAGLNGSSEQPGTLPRALDMLRLAEPTGGMALHFTEYHDAVGRARKNPDGPDQLADLKAAVAATPTAFYQALAADFAAAKDEFARMTAALDERCGSKSPGSSDIARKLEKCADIVQELAGDRLAEASAAEGEAPAPGTQPTAATASPSGAMSREGALAHLLQLAAFFERTEPQSVIPHALRQVVRWGKLSLPQLMMELIEDRDARDKFFGKVGLAPTETQS
ncbi:MAG: type VI secretion system protein TssA [Gemmataceae bacterium]|nr:type VI secretion system protein TssA [Gemmataceae bacterium]